MKWYDDSYSTYDYIRTATTWSCVSGILHITVQDTKGEYKYKWYATYPNGTLVSNNLEGAKIEAIKETKAYLEKLLAEANKLLKEAEEDKIRAQIRAEAVGGSPTRPELVKALAGHLSYMIGSQ